VLNGGVTRVDQAREHLARVDGVMIGRESYQTPWMLAEADGLIFDDAHPLPDQREVIERYLPFVERELARGVPLIPLSRHLVGLFRGMPGARAWRRHLAENAHRKGAGAQVIQQALAKLSRQEAVG